MYPSQISQMTNDDLEPAGGVWPGFMLAALGGLTEAAAAAACMLATDNEVGTVDWRGSGVIDILGCCVLDDFGPGA